MDERYIVSIDLGTSKFALTVAKIDGNNVQIVYYKKFDSDGVRYSRMYNPAKVSAKLKYAIADAEKDLGLKITQAVVGLPKYEVRQESAQMEMERNQDECITSEEIENLKSMALDTYPLENPEREVLLGAVAQSFSNGEDFQLVENDIIGMACKKIEGNFKLFIGMMSAFKNIDIAFNKTGVCVARKYFTPDSTAKAVLFESEMENGVALVDFGAGAVSVSVYYGSIMRHYAAIPFGGKVITTDIKSEFTISETLAENIKLAYGVCMPDKLQSLSEKIIQINSDTAAPVKQVPVKYLSEIITERMKEILEAVFYEIQMSGFADHLKSGIVVTGGGSKTVNCCNYIKELSGYNVRIGYPKHMFSASGYDGIYESDASVSVGMILTAKDEKNLNCALPADAAAQKITIETASEETIAADPKEDIAVEKNDNPTNGILFSEDQLPPKEQKPKLTKGSQNSKMKLSWLKKAKDKLKEVSGDLYENMNKEKI